MEQITILVRNEEKASALMELLRTMDFVDAVDMTHICENNEDADFFQLAGLWRARKIDTDNLRRLAWSGRNISERM